MKGIWRWQLLRWTSSSRPWAMKIMSSHWAFVFFLCKSADVVEVNRGGERGSHCEAVVLWRTPGALKVLGCHSIWHYVACDWQTTQSVTCLKAAGLPERSVLATNTSSISITKLAAKVSRRQNQATDVFAFATFVPTFWLVTAGQSEWSAAWITCGFGFDMFWQFGQPYQIFSAFLISRLIRTA